MQDNIPGPEVPALDREELAKQIYPTPNSGLIVHPIDNPSTTATHATDLGQPIELPHSLQQPRLDSTSAAGRITQMKTAWGKIALVGALMMVPFAVAFYILDAYFGGWGILGLLMTGILPIAGLVLYLASIVIASVLLSKLHAGIDHPRIAASVTLFCIIPVVLFAGFFVPPWATYARYVPLTIWIVGGALGLCAAVFVLEKTRPVTRAILVAALVALYVLAHFAPDIIRNLAK